MPYKQCKVCNETFYARPSHIKKGQGTYCSNVCHYKDARTGVKISCEICGKEIYRSVSKLGGSKSKKYFCTKSCQTKWRNTQYMGERHLKWKDGKSTYKDVILRSNLKKICTLCKTDDIRILAVHHVDQNRQNFELRNLAWLCHNCHRLVHCDKVEKQNFAKEFAKTRKV